MCEFGSTDYDILQGAKIDVPSHIWVKMTNNTGKTSLKEGKVSLGCLSSPGGNDKYPLHNVISGLTSSLSPFSLMQGSGSFLIFSCRVIISSAKSAHRNNAEEGSFWNQMM